MILLYSSKELRFSGPWRNQYDFITDRLPGVCKIDIDIAKSMDLSDEVVMNIGSHHFYQDKDLLAERLAECKFLISIVDDYSYSIITQIRKAVRGKPNVILSNIPTLLSDRGQLEAWSWAMQQYYVNWNLASYREDVPQIAPAEKKGLLYYGSFREGRRLYFRKYLNTDLYPVWLSASERQMVKFKDYLIGPTGKLNFNQYYVEQIPYDLNRFQCSLYIEDEKTHELYNSPANRFYECLSAGIPQIFDRSCLNTFSIGWKDVDGYDISEYVVDSPEEISEMLKQSKTMRIRQMKDWRRDYRSQLKEQFSLAMAQIML